MSNDLLMIKFACPYCAQPIEAPETARDTEIICPGCSRKIIVTDDENIYNPKPDRLPPPGESRKAYREEVDLMTRRQKIAEHGDSFTTFSIIIALIGFIALAAGIICLMNVTSALNAFMASGALFSIAIWLYLVGTIIHIRANTEK